ncbi:outer membrane protein [Shewanella algae]|uniref:outer membrane protein n=1 Tax=Shewanella algae TaxID=38313 RepID=UPI00313CB01C
MTMNKFILTSAMTIFICAPSMAADWFVGGGLGGGQNDYSFKSVNGVDSTDDDSSAVFMLRGGFYLTPQQRLYATYSYQSFDFASQHTGLLSYDYLVPLNRSNKLNWFIGASAGFNYTSPDMGGSSSSDFAWGGQTGLSYHMSNRLSTEVGYRYLKQDYESINNAGKLTLDNSQQVYLSLDYRF